MNQPALLKMSLWNRFVLTLAVVGVIASVPAALAALPAPFSEPLEWTTSEPLISPISDANHDLVSIKDPSVVSYGGFYHVYATVANTTGQWNMVYLKFPTWSQASSAKQIYLDTANPAFAGYHCAPEVFYFTPQKKWYLICQSPQPTYSTADDLSKPETWTAPQNFFLTTPSGAPSSWIDFWVICDDTNAYLFFSGDDGRWYRSQTTLADFPKGFSNPVVVMQTASKFDLFEASCVYHIKGTSEYLAIIECIGAAGRRYFKGFLADSLDGTWTPYHASERDPFAGRANVSLDPFDPVPESNDFSHGELVRDGYDQTLTIDPGDVQFLYQGMDPSTPAGTSYSQLPYRLALLTPLISGVSGVSPTPPSYTVFPNSFVDISTRCYVGTGSSVGVAGFILKNRSVVLVRASGPTLGTQGVANTIAKPQLTIYNSADTPILENVGWQSGMTYLSGTKPDDATGNYKDAYGVDAVTKAVHAFPFTSPDDSAIAVQLPPGLYTAEVKGADGGTGNAIVEVYLYSPGGRLDPANQFSAISTRCYVGTGDSAATVGLILQNPGTVLLRAVGPSLSRYGVSNVLPNPTITLYDSQSLPIQTNTSWQSDPTQAAAIQDATTTVHDFPLTYTEDSAMLVTLPAGTYTAIVKDANGKSGNAIVEAYLVPQTVGPR